MPRTLSALSMQMDRVNNLAQRNLAIAALAAFVTLAPNMIAAQPVFVPSFSLPGLTQDDIARMHAAAARLYDGQSRPVGSSERWRSADTNDTGEVKLVRSFNVNEIPCRTIDYVIRVAGTEDGEHFVLNWCQLAGKGWKIVEDMSPRALNELR